MLDAKADKKLVKLQDALLELTINKRKLRG